MANLWRFPVKSMAGEELEEAEISKVGIAGDRAYALIDGETGDVVSASSARLFPGLLNFRASFVKPPSPGRELPPVRIKMPDGREVTTECGEVDRALSAHFRREVTLARADRTVPQWAGLEFFDESGIAPPGVPGGFFDLYPMSVMTTATLARLAESRPSSRFDLRRFRMNVIVSSDEAGFPENDWVGLSIALGGEARLRVSVPDPRCVMATLAQDDLPHDPGILRAVVRDNSLEIGKAGLLPCAGVYAIIETPGTVRIGDPVAIH